jgi:hypothetical protein
MYAYALIGKGQTLAEEDNYEAAIKCFKDAMLKDSTVKDQSMLNIGICKYRQKDFVSALYYFKRINDDMDGPENEVFFTNKNVLAGQKHNGIGLCYYNLGLDEEAKEEFRLAIKNDPHMADAYYNLGVVYNNEKESERALKLFRACKQIDNKHPEVKKAIERVEGIGKTNDWYQWWFNSTKIRRFLGISLSLIIVLLILSTFDIYFSTLISHDISITQGFLSNFKGLFQMQPANSSSFNTDSNTIITNSSSTTNAENLQNIVPLEVNTSEFGVITLIIPIILLLAILLLPSLKTLKIGTIQIDTSPIDLPHAHIKPTSSITISQFSMPLHFHSPISYDMKMS